MTDQFELDKRLAAAETEIVNIKDRRKELVKEYNDRVDKCEAVIFGNGTPGIDENVRTLLKGFTDLQTEFSKTNEQIGKVLSHNRKLVRHIWAIYGLVSGMLITLGYLIKMISEKV